VPSVDHSCLQQEKIFISERLAFLAELFILLPVYFALKISLEGDAEISSPLLSQLHRMIVNPLLMLVLIMDYLSGPCPKSETR